MAKIGKDFLARLNRYRGAFHLMSLLRPPDRILFSPEPFRHIPGTADGSGSSYEGTGVSCRMDGGVLAVEVRADERTVPRVVLRWDEVPPAGARFLGDHWERAYGDLEWRGIVPDRPMPWYFLRHAAGKTAGWGVRTGANSFCFWTADARGFSLWLDLRNGTNGVRLAGRTLRAAEVVAGEWEGSPFAAARAFCRMMSSRPKLPAHPVYGANDFYFAYGASTHGSIVRDSELVSGLAGNAENRPYSVIDGGWQFESPDRSTPWHLTNWRFPDMARLAREIRDTGCRPGLWVRPLLMPQALPASWYLPKRAHNGPNGHELDPSVPEVLEQIRADFRRVTGWGYEIIKHDFSTYDILALWGFEMKGALTAGTWKFHDESRTTAEIITGLYRAIRAGAGDALIIGCNTVGHLAAGLFELQRIGDDTSGRNWERNRRMGVNSLAFRLPQHDSFFHVDADCLGLTGAIPWDLNRQWLSLLAKSGTPLFVSIDPEHAGPEQQAALREAFAIASRPQPPGEPLDWMETTCPERWKLAGKEVAFDWSGPAGASSFMMG